MRRYLFNLLIGFDQLANVFGGGHPDETISSRTHKAALTGKRRAVVFEALINLMFAFPPMSERNHCENSAEWDEGDFL